MKSTFKRKLFKVFLTPPIVLLIVVMLMFLGIDKTERVVDKIVREPLL